MKKLEQFDRLVEAFGKIPGVGKKSAIKYAYYVALQDPFFGLNLAHTIENSNHNLKHCIICSGISQNEICDICKDESRETSTICVVQSMKDVFAFERINEYHGLYHVLHGLISPMDGISPEDINIPKLLERMQKSEVEEIIMATGPTVEGEATAMYISRLLKPLGLKITKLAYGIPIGASLEYADDVTLAIALNSRREI